MKTVDIIWNITMVCPWDCAICCVDAVHVSRRDGLIRLTSNGFSDIAEIPVARNQGSIFDQALAFRQGQGQELDFAGKLRVLDNLNGFLPKLDFSGGDPLATAENIEIMRIASQRFGREHVTLTATGSGLARCKPSEIAPLIGELNFTFDQGYHLSNSHRPDEYAAQNLKKAALFAEAGVKTRAECPLSTNNVNPDSLRQIYLNLHDAGIDKLLPMRLFPVGRGELRAADVPSRDQYMTAIEVLRKMEARLGTPKVKLQCALRFLENAHPAENPCDMFRESFGLTADGMLRASAWASGRANRPLDDAWVMGNLATTPLQEILATEKAQGLVTRLNENFGHCKVFAFLYSNRDKPVDRMFDSADPLYCDKTDMGRGREREVCMDPSGAYESTN